MNDGQQPQDPLHVEKSATTEDFAAYDALVELAGPDSPPGAESFPLGSTRRLGVRLRAATFFGVFLALTLIAVVILLFVGFATDRSGSEPDAPGAAPPPAAPAAQPLPDTDAAQPATSEGRLWYFTNTEGVGLYTIALQGDGATGPIDVIEDTTDTGTYSWVDGTLTIDFTRKFPMVDGYLVTDPWRFECEGTPESAQMACEVTIQDWAYSIEDGLEVRGENSWPALAVPR